MIANNLDEAVTELKTIRQIASSLENPDLTLAADSALSAIASTRGDYVDLQIENQSLKEQLALKQAVNQKGDICPSCKQRSYEIVATRKNTHFGDMGVVDRTYLCSSCKFTEERTVDPSKE